MKKYIFNDNVIFKTKNFREAEELMKKGAIPIDWQNSKGEFLVDKHMLIGKEMPIQLFETKLGLLACKQNVFVVNSVNLSILYCISSLCGYVEDNSINYMIALILSYHTYKIKPKRLREIPVNLVRKFKHYSKNNTLVGSLDALNMLICNAKNEAIAKNEIRLM